MLIDLLQIRDDQFEIWFDEESEETLEDDDHIIIGGLIFIKFCTREPNTGATKIAGITYKSDTIIKMHLYDSLVHVSIYSDIIGIHVEYTSV